MRLRYYNVETNNIYKFTCNIYKFVTLCLDSTKYNEVNIHFWSTQNHVILQNMLWTSLTICLQTLTKNFQWVRGYRWKLLKTHFKFFYTILFNKLNLKNITWVQFITIHEQYTEHFKIGQIHSFLYGIWSKVPEYFQITSLI